MSRTVRRKSGETPKSYTKEHVRQGLSYVWVWVPLTGKALKKSLARYHSDNGWGYKTFRYKSWCENDIRSLTKQELDRWKKNPDYEVQIRLKRFWEWD